MFEVQPSTHVMPVTYAITRMQQGMKAADGGLVVHPVPLDPFHDWLAAHHPELIGFKASLAFPRWIRKQVGNTRGH